MARKIFFGYFMNEKLILTPYFMTILHTSGSRWTLTVGSTIDSPGMLFFDGFPGVGATCATFLTFFDGLDDIFAKIITYGSCL